MKFNDKDFLKSLEDLDPAFELCPILEFTIFGVSFYIWKTFEFSLDFLETEPYERNGKVPLIFLYIGPIQVLFENKTIYKYLYKRRYNGN